MLRTPYESRHTGSESTYTEQEERLQEGCAGVVLKKRTILSSQNDACGQTKARNITVLHQNGLHKIVVIEQRAKQGPRLQ